MVIIVEWYNIGKMLSWAQTNISFFLSKTCFCKLHNIFNFFHLFSVFKYVKYYLCGLLSLIMALYATTLSWTVEDSREELGLSTFIT